MNRSLLLSGAMVAALVLPAHADDLTISTATTSPVATSAAANGTPGNITITSSGSVAISQTGAAVTLDSDAFVVNAGTISNSVGSSALGVQILGNTTGGFTNSGNISIAGTGTPPSSVSQDAVIVSGNGTFTGDIITTAGSSITIAGKDARAIRLESPVIGNLSLGGQITATGETTGAVSIASPLTGAIVNRGSILTVSGSSSTTSVNPSPGETFAIGGSVTGGILNAGPISSGDTTPAATIGTSGRSASVLIAPSVGGDAGSISIGEFSDSTNPGYGFLNRGTISAIGTQPTISTLAIQIGEAAGNTNGLTTTLSGGLFNRGTILASATSDNGNATGVASSSTDATAIVIGARAIVPTITNEAAGTITATTGGPVGGTATTISIVSGGSLSSLENAGSIVASANATGGLAAPSAYAIRDSGGKLTSIVNSGTISATQTTPNGTLNMIAADLSSSTLATTFTNTGIVKGSILFGSALNNALTVEGATASIDGTIRTSGSGTVDVTISGSGAGGKVTTTGITKAGILTVGSGGRLDITVDQSTSATITAAGNVSFDPASRVHLAFESLPLSGSDVTIIHSDTSLTFGDFGATVEPFVIPFMFTGNLTAGAKDLTLVLHRKTASEIGLTGDAATIFEPAMQAAAQDTNFASAITEIGSAGEAQSTLEQMLPVLNDATRRIAVSLTDSQTGVVSARQRALAMAVAAGGGGGVWGQGFRNEFKDTGGNGYDGNGAGGTIGVDIFNSNRGHLGAAFTIFRGDAAQKVPATTKSSVEWRFLTLYMGARLKDAFFNAQSSIGTASVEAERTVNVGSLTRVALSSSWRELLASGSFGAGYVFHLGSVNLAPEAVLDAMYLNSSAYHENGGGTAVDLSVDARGEHSVRGFLGLTANDTIATGQLRIVPQVLAGLSQELKASSGRINAQFTDVPGSNFSLAGPKADASSFVVGAGLDLTYGFLTAMFNYDATKGSSTLVQSARASVLARF